LVTVDAYFRVKFATITLVILSSSPWDNGGHMTIYKLAVAALLLSACAPMEVPVAVRIANALPAANVVARAETDPVGTAAADAADDPAIWRNAANPAASLIVGTDKKAGLHIYTLDGRSRHFAAAGLINNVDLFDSGKGIFVVGSDRNDPANSRLLLYRLNTDSRILEPLGKVESGPGEAYGICIDASRSSNRELMLFAAIKDGSVRQIRVALDAPGGLSAQTIRTLKLATQIEGCVVDPETRSLFVGEEDIGIWRFAADADGSAVGHLVVPADGKQLVADVEGLALVRHAGRSLLVASSQGDNSYAIFGVPADAQAALPLVGRFRIADGAVGGTSETDGIELMLGDFGPDYPEGLFVAQDGENAPLAQNFKLVGWREIRAALGL
jgi:3-phytase